MDPNQLPVPPQQPQPPQNTPPQDVPFQPQSTQPQTVPPTAPAGQPGIGTVSPDLPQGSPAQPQQLQATPGVYSANSPAPAQPYVSNQSSYPQYNMAQNNKRRPYKILISIAVLTVVIIGVGVVVATRGANSPISSIKSTIGGTNTVEDRDGDSLDLSPLIDDASRKIKDQTIKAKVHQQLNLSPGLSYMITKVERLDTLPGLSQYDQLAPGKEFVKATVVVGNHTKSDVFYASNLNLHIRNSAGGVQDSTYVSREVLPGQLNSMSTEISGGKQLTGVVVFAVDKSENITFVSDLDYKVYGSSENEDKTYHIQSEVSP